MTISLGNTPESWGIFGPSSPDQIPWDRCLDEMVEAGYEYLELGQYGYLPTNPKVLRTELDKRGLTLTAGTVVTELEDPNAWGKHEAETVKVGQLAASVGAEYLVMIDTSYSENSASPFTGETRLSPERWETLVEATNRLGQLVKERFGLRLTFHPCGDNYVQYEDQIEALLDETNPDLVSLCLDTGHHAYSQGDPVEFMRSHHDRIPYVHIKSVSSEILDRTIKDGLTISDATKAGVFCEPYLGSVDFKAFANVLSEVGYHGIALVEQDLYRPPADLPIQIAKRARNHFLQAGIA
ncbi:sugar phosphate isomerase/epimerase [Dehalococcoidia bacterium]|nr:sugar phosphate isomerase/epimerase [Dehalococcoidia bacterium]